MNTDSRTAQTRTSWRKSSYSSGTGSCVEVAPVAEGVVIRHSKRPSAGTITFPNGDWAAFVRDALDGHTSTSGVATITTVGTDTLVTSLNTNVELRFDEGEWSAFLAGATNGEFDFTSNLTSVVPLQPHPAKMVR